MSTVWRWLSRLLLVPVFLIALVAAIWAYGRLTSPTPQQEAAIALMHEAPVGDGENGYPILLSLPPAPAGAMPEILNCGEPARPCLAAVEAAPEASAAALLPYLARLDTAERALHAPVFRDTRADVDPATAPLPSFQPVTQLDARRALAFNAGDTVGALAAACDDALGAMRWARSPNTLIDGMIGIAAFRQFSLLIAEMRQRAPADPLPASCMALSVAPDAAVEGTLCPAMRGEFRFLQGALRSMGADLPAGSGPEWLRPLLHDEEWLLARSAERFVGTCGPAAEAAAREDRPALFAPVRQRWVDRVSFPVSVVLDQIAEPAYQPYPERQLDFVAMRRLLAAFLQMEAMAPALSNVERFEALPPALRDGPRPLVLAEDGASVSVLLRSNRAEAEGGDARLPLPQRIPTRL